MKHKLQIIDGVRCINGLPEPLLREWVTAMSDTAGFIDSQPLSTGICVRLAEFRIRYRNRTREQHANLYSEIGDLWQPQDYMMSVACRRWDKYSGNECYPVPMPESMRGDFQRYCAEEDYCEDSTDEACFAYEECDNLWEGELGELRRELLSVVLEVASEWLVILHSAPDSAFQIIGGEND